MPNFVYKAKKGPQEVVHGEMAAETADDVVRKLDEMGLIPVSIVEQGAHTQPSSTQSDGKKSQPEARTRKIKSKDDDAFTWQLASLVKASVPILRALTLIAQQTDNRALQIVVEDLKNQVKDGRTLSE